MSMYVDVFGTHLCFVWLFNPSNTSLVSVLLNAGGRLISMCKIYTPYNLIYNICRYIYIEYIYILINYQTIHSNVLHGCLLHRWLAGWVDGWIDGVTHAHSCSTYLDLHPGQEKNKSRGPRHLQKTYTVDKIWMYHPGIGPFKWCIPRNCKGQKPRIVKI